MKVVVALSGGVDSAVAAARLVRAGHDVVGVTMRFADLTACGLGASRCCAPGDVELAARTAWTLGIRHEVIDLGPEFVREVLDPFVDAYLAGETPSPCVRCNSRVKFGAVLPRLAEFDGDALATGHYARREVGAAGEPVLSRGVDRAKDQAYFLWELTRDQLRSVVLPLGAEFKRDVRRQARDLGLPSADKADSQEICFVPPGGSYRDVLAALAPGRLPGAGDIVDAAGRVVGRHGGFHLFTVGQRHGLGVAAGERRYVTSLLAAANRVVAGSRTEAERRTLVLRDVNWLVDPPAAPLRAAVQIRSRHIPAAATISAGGGGTAVVEFDAAVLAPAPGQAAVFHAGDRVLGGGWIRSTS